LVLMKAYEPSILPVLPMSTSWTIFAVLWFVLPGMIFFDIINLHRGPSDRAPNRMLWSFGAFMFPFVGVAVYSTFDLHDTIRSSKDPYNGLSAYYHPINNIGYQSQNPSSDARNPEIGHLGGETSLIYLGKRVQNVN